MSDICKICRKDFADCRHSINQVEEHLKKISERMVRNKRLNKIMKPYLDKETISGLELFEILSKLI